MDSIIRNPYPTIVEEYFYNAQESFKAFVHRLVKQPSSEVLVPRWITLIWWAFSHGSIQKCICIPGGSHQQIYCCFRKSLAVISYCYFASRPYCQSNPKLRLFQKILGSNLILLLCKPALLEVQPKTALLGLLVVSPSSWYYGKGSILTSGSKINKNGTKINRYIYWNQSSGNCWSVELELPDGNGLTGLLSNLLEECNIECGIQSWLGNSCVETFMTHTCLAA